MKIKIKKSEGRGQEGCVQRMEVIVVKRKKSWGGGRGGSDWGGDQGICEQRSEAFVNIQKKKFGGGGRGGQVRGGRVGGSGWGVRMDVNGEVKFL